MWLGIIQIGEVLKRKTVVPRRVRNFSFRLPLDSGLQHPLLPKFPASCGLLFGICWVVGALCSLSFGPLSDVHLFGDTIFDFFDNLSSNILMTLGSLFTVLFVGWRLKKTDIYDEFTNGGSLRTNVKIFGLLWFLIRYICPVAITVIFLLGVL